MFTLPRDRQSGLGAWLVFALALRWLTRGGDRFALSAVIGGVALARTVILLIGLAGRGPGRYWYDFWTEPGLRSLYITVALGAFCWTVAVAYLVLRGAYGLPGRRASGATLVGAGVPLAALGSLVAVIGLERALTIWNDQMALLPWACLASWASRRTSASPPSSRSWRPGSASSWPRAGCSSPDARG